MLSLSTKWFLWLSVAVALFAVGQVVGMIWIEFIELSQGGSLAEELAEISVLVSISVCVFLLMLGWLWFMSRRMMRPIRSIAESAARIAEGDFGGRIEGRFIDDEVGMLVSTINRAFDSYHGAVARLESFAGHAAHQLRTPLAAIRSAGEVCLQKERSAGEYRECIAGILEAAEKLSASVAKLLMIARLNPEKIRSRFQHVDLSGILTRSVDLYRLNIEAKNAKIVEHVDAGVVVLGDAGLIQEALKNLIDNAVCCTPEHGRITVAVHAEGAVGVVAIRDDGPGMPDGVRAVVTGEARHMYQDGLLSGRFGLVIVSEVVRIHGGTIEVEAEEGQGTCIRVRLPIGRGTGPEYC